MINGPGQMDLHGTTQTGIQDSQVVTITLIIVLYYMLILILETIGLIIGVMWGNISLYVKHHL